MSISAIGTNTAVTSAAEVKRKQANLWSQGPSSTGAPAQDTFTSDFASILASVQSGDITSAQAALTKLTGDQPPTDAGYSPSSTSATTSTTSSSSGSSPSSDVQALLQAVQGGDIGAAQQALSSLQTDMANLQAPPADAASATGAATQKAAHHHHHHHHAASTSSTSSSASSSATDATNPDSTDVAADAFGVSA